MLAVLFRSEIYPIHISIANGENGKTCWSMAKLGNIYLNGACKIEHPGIQDIAALFDPH